MSQELDSGTLTLLILIGYWYWRLSRSIGNRPPTDLKADKAGRSGPALPLPKRIASSPATGENGRWGQPVETGSAAAEALAAIRAVDRTFDAASFLRGAVAAYEAVLTAFAEADVGVLADLASADVYGPFVAAIAEREKQGERVEWKLLSVQTVKIADAALVERSASITVRFSSQFITYSRRANGDLVDAAGESVVDVTDDWTFARELLGRTPNWKLIATGSA